MSCGIRKGWWGTCGPSTATVEHTSGSTATPTDQFTIVCLSLYLLAESTNYNLLLFYRHASSSMPSPTLARCRLRGTAMHCCLVAEIPSFNHRHRGRIYLSRTSSPAISGSNKSSWLWDCLYLLAWRTHTMQQGYYSTRINR